MTDPYCRKHSKRAVGGSEEKRSRRDEQTETHAPEMPRDALRAEKAAAQGHAKVASGSKEHHRTHEEGHPNGNLCLAKTSYTC